MKNEFQFFVAVFYGKKVTDEEILALPEKWPVSFERMLEVLYDDDQTFGSGDELVEHVCKIWQFSPFNTKRKNR